MLNQTRFGYKNAWFLYNGEDIENSDIVCFQSYQTLMWVYDAKRDTVHMSPYKHSVTTSKQVTQSFGYDSPMRSVFGRDTLYHKCEPSDIWLRGNISHMTYKFKHGDSITIDCEVIEW